jgi:NADH-quinone oxidoreductase subunit G
VAAVSLAERVGTVSPEEVGRADCIAIYETDLREEGPMLLLAVRQAWLRGAPVLLVGDHAPLEQIKAVGVEAVQIQFMEEAPLAIFDRPVVICGTAHGDPDVIGRMDLTGARVACTLAGPNGLAAAMLSMRHSSIPFEEALVGGKIKALIAVESDIPLKFIDNIPFIAALDWRDTPAVRRGEIVIPTASWLETDGTYVSYEGRAQRFSRVMHAGLPVRGLDPAGHPPRTHRQAPPGGDLPPAWQVLAELIRLTGKEVHDEPLSGEWGALAGLDPEGEGGLLFPGEGK